MDLTAPFATRRSGRTLSRRELVGWAVLLFAFAQLADLLQFEMGDAAEGNRQVMDAIALIAWGAVAAMLWRDRADAPARSWQVATMLLLAGVGAVATGRAMFVPLGVAGLVLVLGKGWSPGQRGAGIILFAMAFQKLGAKAIAMLLADPILRLDTAAAGAALRLIVPGTTWSGTMIKPPHDVGVMVQMPCSSFSNLSLVCLCYTSLAVLDGARSSRRNLLAVAAACLVVAALNTVRLLLMARSLATFQFWHEGAGNDLFAVTMSIAAVVLSSLGSRWANRRG